MFHSLLALIVLAQVAVAEFKVPPLTGPVMDQAGVLSVNTRSGLTRYLLQLREHSGTQIQVAILPNLDGLPIEQASIQITDQWKLGKKKEDRGVLLLLAIQEHKVRIEVGQGLEGDLPDAIANRIIREEISPRLKAGDMDQGVVEGVLSIAHYTDPNFEPQGRREKVQKPPLGKLLTLLFWLLIFLIFILPRGRGRGGGLQGFATGVLLGGLGRGGGGGWGGSSGGGGWSGGGGGFSGGGASGDW